MNMGFQQRIRELEIEQVVPLMPLGSTVLEIGAGAGWQARKLADCGFDVKAVDVAGSRYEGCRSWDVLIYDGKTLPFPTGSMDIVFTSHVLDHVLEPAAFLAEIKRVLRTGGMAIHMVPTVTWRLWTTVTHYPQRGKQLMGLLWERLFDGKGRNRLPMQVSSSKMAILLAGFLKNDLIVPRLGARGNAWTELRFFSGKAREGFFQQTGWRIVSAHPNGLYYSGNKILGPILDLRTRQELSRILGSSSVGYVVVPIPDANTGGLR